jgi:hypothetical protein
MTDTSTFAVFTDQLFLQLDLDVIQGNTLAVRKILGRGPAVKLFELSPDRSKPGFFFVTRIYKGQRGHRTLGSAPATMILEWLKRFDFVVDPWSPALLHSLNLAFLKARVTQ